MIAAVRRLIASRIAATILVSVRRASSGRMPRAVGRGDLAEELVHEFPAGGRDPAVAAGTRAPAVGPLLSLRGAVVFGVRSTPVSVEPFQANPSHLSEE